jgi:hypothetical protein
MEENLWRCGIQSRRFFCIASYNSSGLYLLRKKGILRCGIQCRKSFYEVVTVHCIRFSCGVGYNRRKIPALCDTMEKNLLAIQRLFSIVSHNGKNLFLCVPQRRKTFSVVSHNGKKLFLCIPQRKKPLPLYPKMEKKLKT